MAQDAVLQLKLTLDGGNLKVALADAGKGLDQLGAIGEQTAAEIDQVRQEFERIASQRTAIQSFRALEAELDKVSADFVKAKAEAQRLALALSQVDDPKLQAAFAKASEGAQRLERQQQGLRAALFATSAALTEAGIDANNLTRAEQRLIVDTGRATRAMTELNGRVADLRQRANDSVAPLTQSLRNLAAASGLALGAAGVIQATRAYTQAADSVALLKARLQDAAGAQGDVNAAFQQIFELAQQTRAPLQETAQLYTQIARNADQLGLAQQDLLTLTQAVNQSFRIAGAGQAQAAAATQQFVQAIGSGKLAGDELKSILENNSVLAKALADSLGVNVGALKDLGAQGVITSEVLAKSILASADQLNQRFQQAPQTVSDGVTKIGNSLTRLAGNVNQGSGLIAGALDNISRTIDMLSGFFEDPAPTQYAGKLDAAGEAAAKAAEEQRKLALETARLITNLDQSTAALDKYAKAQTDIADAQQARADAQAKIAKLTQDEAAATAAALAAANQRIENAKQEAAFTEEQIALSQARIDALQKQLDADTKLSEQGRANRQKEIQDSQQALDLLRQKADSQQINIQLLQAEAAALNPVLTAARLRAEAAERETQARERATVASQDFLQAEIELNRAAQESATAQGNETRARQLKIQGLQLEAKLAADLAQKKRDELAALSQTLAARQAELTASRGNTTALKQEIAELQASIVARAQEIRVLDANTAAKERNARAFQAGTIESAKRVTAEVEAGNKAREEERQKTRESTDATDENTQANLENADSQNQRSTAMNLLDGVLGETLKKIEEVNAAQQLGADSSNEALNRLNAAYKALLGNLELVNQFGRGGTAAFDPELFKRIRLIEDYRDRLADAVEVTERLNKATQDGTLTAGQLAQATQAAANASKVLSQEDLAQLRSAISDARNKMREMADATQSAQDRIAELDADLAAARGEDLQAEKLRRQLKLQQDLRAIDAERRKAELEGNQALLKALDEQERKIRQLADLNEQNAERNARQRRDRNRDNQDQGGGRQQSGGGISNADGRDIADRIANSLRENPPVVVMDGELVSRKVIPQINRISSLRR